ncbi:HlyD family efflux transporter periplasmic adaptor subunit, partial [Mycobacterium sp. SMC-13]|uniref:HlyD family efflux transporter periplasmic adaptor subunit n=1 Tax=Mycobacterium sp. SMC-13 TaxID=3381626 RepID=UPI0038769664
MATAKPINLRVRPLQSVDLSFAIDGIIGAQTDPHILGRTVQRFDLTAFCADLSAVSTERSDPQMGAGAALNTIALPADEQPLGWGRLRYDSTAIRSQLAPHILCELRAEAVKATVDKAIAQRENAWVQKFERNALAATQEAFNKFDPNSKLRRIDRLASISQIQHDRMQSAYGYDLAKEDLTSYYGLIRDTFTNTNTATDNRVSTTHTTSTTTPQANNVSKVDSSTTQDWSPQAPDAAKRTSSVSQSRTTEYPYRMPGLDNEANYERAQSSLQEERIAAVAATNYASGDNYERPEVGGLRYFMNDLKSIDLDVKLLQIAYLNTLLISPIDGVVTGIYRNVGDNVSAGQPVMRVENDSEVYIVGVLKYRGLIRLGQQAQMNRPEFDAHLLSREGCSHHAEEVRRG